MSVIVLVFRIPGDELLIKHIDQWTEFWDKFQVVGKQKDGKDDLVII